MYADRRMALYAVGTSAALPLAGPWALLLGPLLYGLTRLFRAFSAENGKVPPWLNFQEFAMAGPNGVERRKKPRRDEDIMPMERLSALEREAKKDRRELRRHVEGCESAAEKNAADNAKIIATQAEQGTVLVELQEVLPWLKAQYSSSKWWRDLSHSVAQFFWGMIRKNLDSASGKLIYLILAAVLVWRGASWADVLKWIPH